MAGGLSRQLSFCSNSSNYTVDVNPALADPPAWCANATFVQDMVDAQSRLWTSIKGGVNGTSSSVVFIGSRPFPRLLSNIFNTLHYAACLFSQISSRRSGRTVSTTPRIPSRSRIWLASPRMGQSQMLSSSGLTVF